MKLIRHGIISGKLILTIVIVTFCFSFVLTDILRLRNANAVALELGLPAPTHMLKISKDMSFSLLKGIKVNPNNPFDLEFIIDSFNDQKFSEVEAQRLVKYFIAGLAVPADKLWVNLSPYEANRVVSDELMGTDLANDMLCQDYVLKQLASSLTHPDTPTGKTYWSMESGDSKLDIGQEMGKIWIVPGIIDVYEQDNLAIITDAQLDIKSESQTQSVLLSEIKKDVNNGKNFARLRQVYYSLVLANWFKRKYSETLFAEYFDSEQLNGIDTADPAVKQKVFNLYVEAFKKGVYNFTRKEKKIRRKYFSGGENFVTLGSSAIYNSHNDDELIDFCFCKKFKVYV